MQPHFKCRNTACFCSSIFNPIQYNSIYDD